MNRIFYFLLGLSLIATGLYQSYLFNEIQYTLISKGVFNWMGSDIFLRISSSVLVATGILLLFNRCNRWFYVLSITLIAWGFFNDVFFSSELFHTPSLSDHRNLSLFWMWLLPLMLIFPASLERFKWWLSLTALALGIGIHCLLAPPYYQDYYSQTTYLGAEYPDKKIRKILDDEPWLKKGKTLLVFVSPTCSECQTLVDKLNASMLGGKHHKRDTKNRIKVLYFVLKFPNRHHEFEYPPINGAGERLISPGEMYQHLPEGANTPALYVIEDGEIIDFRTGWYINKPFLDWIFSQ